VSARGVGGAAARKERLHADWYFDVVSPYAYLQFVDFVRLPADLHITCKPVLFAGLLNHWGGLGPAEIPAKRRQTFRYCDWLARRRGVPFRTPPRHPFNPLALLRLIIAAGSTHQAVAAVFHHVWGTGQESQEFDALRPLATSLGIADLAAAVADPAVKHRLRANTEEAVGRGVFGIPTFAVDGELFWGQDTTDMMLEFLADPAGFRAGDWARLHDVPVAAARKESRL
jgi:2-hydroxychromene-2-carboxylate isomerase